MSGSVSITRREAHDSIATMEPVHSSKSNDASGIGVCVASQWAHNERRENDSSLICTRISNTARKRGSYTRIGDPFACGKRFRQFPSF